MLEMCKWLLCERCEWDLYTTLS